MINMPRIIPARAAIPETKASIKVSSSSGYPTTKKAIIAIPKNNRPKPIF